MAGRATPRRSQALAAAREWLWAHTAQPNGQPWDDDPEHLERAAAELLADLGVTVGQVAA